MTALLAGCDLDDDPKRDAPVVTVPDDPFVAESGDGAKVADGPFTVDEVLRAYTERIGLNLRIDDRLPGGGVTLTTLPGPPYAPTAPDLGLFSVYVFPDAQAADAYVGRSGLEEEEIQTEPGVRFVASPSGVSAKARFGNVLLDWLADDLEETDERFQRLVDPLESLGGDAIERPSMRPCEELAAPSDAPEAGPSSGSTCRLGPQVVTFADPETTLGFGGVEVELAGVGPGGLKSPEVYDVLPNPRPLSQRTFKRKPRPIPSNKGQFLVLRLKLENGTEEALAGGCSGVGEIDRGPADSSTPADGPCWRFPGLVINGVLYDSDPDAFFVDKEPAPFPLAPGDSKELVLLFDLPGAALAELTSPDTALVFVDPRNPYVFATPGTAPTVTRLRLFN